MTQRLKLVLLAFLAVLGGCGGDATTPLARVGAMEIPVDSNYRRWWHNAARCLSIDTTYDRKLRYFIGDIIPREWDGEPGSGFGGYTSPADHLILFARGYELDSAVVVHEQLHDYIGHSGHPAKFFTDTVAARCHYWPGHD